MAGQHEQYSYTPLPEPVRVTEQQWPDGTVPLVTIRCITYNHVKFIRDAIEGFLMQETTFPVEILIHDDASTDSTADIVREYEAKYPQLIKAIYQTENQYSQGKSTSVILNSLARGKYCAVCEGDDYWILADKLERQIELFRRDPKCVLVGARAYLWTDGDPGPFAIQPAQRPEVAARLGPADFFVKGPWMHTATRVWLTDFRRQLRRDIPDPRAAPDLGQAFYVAAAARQGRVSIRFLDAVTSVYRKHPGGVWSGRSICAGLEREVHVLQTVRRFFSPRDQRKLIDPLIGKKLVEIIKRCKDRSVVDRMKLFGRLLRCSIRRPMGLVHGMRALLSK